MDEIDITENIERRRTDCGIPHRSDLSKNTVNDSRLRRNQDLRSA